ncbi:hypothetical protein P376_0158 [Streptomyces sp. HCCB10043]|nr:hypothetical protein P376_0158 [Streptomyces sp. HCCB10043]
MRRRGAVVQGVERAGESPGQGADGARRRPRTVRGRGTTAWPGPHRGTPGRDQNRRRIRSARPRIPHRPPRVHGHRRQPHRGRDLNGRTHPPDRPPHRARRRGNPHRTRRRSRHSPLCRERPRPPRLRHLHLRLHRSPQGRRHQPRQCRTPVHRMLRQFRLRTGPRLDALPLVRLRLLGLGDLGRAASRRAARRRAVRGDSFSRRIPRAARRAAGHAAEPDTVRVPSADGGRPPGAGALRRAGPATCGLRRRGARPVATARLVRPAARLTADAREHVRHHRDHRPRHGAPAGGSRDESFRQPDRSALGRSAGVRPRRTAPPGAPRHRRRDVRGRRRSGPRLSGTPRSDRRAVRGRPEFPFRRPSVPHRRPGQGAARRGTGVCGPRGPAGEDPRLPDRTRRDRGRAGHTRGCRPGGGPGAGRADRRPTACRARGARAAAPGADPGRTPRAPRGDPAGVHGAVRVPDPGRAAADGQRKARPRGAGRAVAGRNPHPETASDAAGRDPVRVVRRRPPVARRRGRRRLLRPGRPFPAGDAPPVGCQGHPGCGTRHPRPLRRAHACRARDRTGGLRHRPATCDQDRPAP